jgi:hypothetical protein
VSNSVAAWAVAPRRSSPHCARPSFSAWRTMPRTVAAPRIRCSFCNYKGKKLKAQGYCATLWLRAVHPHVDGDWVSSLNTSWCVAAASAVTGSGKSLRPIRGMTGGSPLMRVRAVEIFLQENLHSPPGPVWRGKVNGRLPN